VTPGSPEADPLQRFTRRRGRRTRRFAGRVWGSSGLQGRAGLSTRPPPTRRGASDVAEPCRCPRMGALARSRNGFAPSAPTFGGHHGGRSPVDSAVNGSTAPLLGLRRHWRRALEVPTTGHA